MCQLKINILLSKNVLLAKKYIFTVQFLTSMWDHFFVCWAQVLCIVFGSAFSGLVQKFFLFAKLAKERNCLASIIDTNGDWGIHEAAGLKNATSSFIPASLPWSLGPIDEVGGSIVVAVLISSPSRRPSKSKNFLIIFTSQSFKVPTPH